MINEKQKKLEELSKKVEEDKTGKFDKAGKARIPIYSEISEYKQAEKIDEILIEITQRELVEAGILPEDIEWSKGRITTKDIGRASMEKGVRKEEEKGVWTNLVDMIKNMFNERG